MPVRSKRGPLHRKYQSGRAAHIDIQTAILLARVDDLGVRRDRAPPRLELGEPRQLVGLERQGPFNFCTRALALAAMDLSSLTMNAATAAVLPVVACASGYEAAASATLD